MKNQILKLTSIILLILFTLTMMPTLVKAADESEGIILEKSDQKIIYIKGMESTEFKYAFSNEDNSSDVSYTTASKDTNGEYVAYIDGTETYKYMFIAQGDKTETVELDTFKSITEEEIKEVENLTKIINVSTDESTTKVSQNDGTTVTKTRGKIVVKDDGTYEYQLIKLTNKTAKELYDQLSTLSNAEKMYDKLLAEIKIRDDYAKLLKDASWKDAKNKEILEPENAQDGEKYVVLIREVKDSKTVRTDVQFMTCGREDAEGVEKTEKEEEKTVTKKTKLPVTGENLALYISLGVIILAIIFVAIKMKKSKKEDK